MKTIFTFLTVAFATLIGSSLFGSDSRYIADYHFLKDYPVSYTYVEGEGPGEICVEPLAGGEVFRILLVRDTRTGVDHTTEPAVKIDGAGQIVLGETASGAIWADILVSDEAEDEAKGFILSGVNEDNSGTGIPNALLGVSGSYGFTTQISSTVTIPDNGKGGTIYRYLVALDTRKGDGTCEGAPTHVARYAMTFCPASGDAATAPQKYYILGETITQTGLFVIDWPGRDLGWQPAAAITSLETAEGTLTGDALTAALTSEITDFEQDANTNALTLTPSVPAVDVLYYTLYTNDRLAPLTDESWIRFADLSNNGLDNSQKKAYTRFRIDGESLSIPKIEGEATRFYLIRGE